MMQECVHTHAHLIALLGHCQLQALLEGQQRVCVIRCINLALDLHCSCVVF